MITSPFMNTRTDNIILVNKRNDNLTPLFIKGITAYPFLTKDIITSAILKGHDNLTLLRMSSAIAPSVDMMKWPSFLMMASVGRYGWLLLCTLWLVRSQNMVLVRVAMVSMATERDSTEVDNMVRK